MFIAEYASEIILTIENQLIDTVQTCMVVHIFESLFCTRVAFLIDKAVEDAEMHENIRLWEIYSDA